MGAGAGLIAAAVVPELFKIGAGIFSGIRSAKYAKTPRPAYEIPQAYKDFLAATKFRAGTSGLPGQGQIEARLARQTAGSMGAIQRSGRSAASQIAGIAALDQASKEQVAELGVQGARQDERDLQQMYEAQRLMGTEQRRQWEWDKRGPYENAMATAARLQEASQQAIFTGLEGISGIAQSAMMLNAKTPGDTTGTTETTQTTGGTTTPQYFNLKNVYGTGASKPVEEYGAEDMGGYTDVQLPNEITNGFNSQYYGMPINDEMSDYYGMNTNFNRLFNSLFQRRGTTRTRNYKIR